MIDKILANVGNSKIGNKFFAWSSKPDSEKFLNNTIPQIETAFSTACYMFSTAKQKNIDDDRKKMLQIQHVASGLVGIIIASKANRAVGKFGEKVIENLDTSKINADVIKQISTGIRIAIPLLVTSCIMRFLIPSAIACFSGKAMDKVRENRDKSKRLDLKV